MQPPSRTEDSAIDRASSLVLTPGLDSKSLSTLTFGLSSVLHALLYKPDVALVMNVANGFWLPLLKLRGIPTVVNVDGIEWHRDKWSRLGKAVFKWGAQFTARFADELVFDAVAIGDFWQREFSRTGIFIPYGGDPVTGLDPRPRPRPTTSTSCSSRASCPRTASTSSSTLPRPSPTSATSTSCWSARPLLGDPLQLKAEATGRRPNPRVRLTGHLSDDRRLFGLWSNAGVYFHGHTVGGTNPALVQAMSSRQPHRRSRHGLQP